MSRSSIGISARRSTTLASSAGVGMVKRAPFIWVACAVPASAMLRRKGNTCSETISNIVPGSLFFSLRPAHFLIGDAATLADAVLAFREDAPLDRLAEAVGLVLFTSMGVIQPAHEQEVSDLFDHFERIGDATRPKGIPYIVDLGAKFAGQHNTPEIHISRVAIPSISKRAKHSGPRIRFASQFFSSCAEMDLSSVSSRQFAAWPPRSPSDINGLRNRACCR